ncbi:PepSY-associated TM helix domain-containing protein [Bordetella tumulicola]|uniref:PepSY-associated TM helix domain-containing protein n=1 Tax=Bordetella tumulicola TaxID=1649133 RepID=UPI0039EE6A23
MRAVRSKTWYLVHKWTSLACTVFMLVVCVSGLPLIFRDEIVDWLDAPPSWPSVVPSTPAPSLDGLVAQTLQRYPAHRIVEIDVASDSPSIIMALAPSHEAPSGTSSIRLQYDARSGLLQQAVHHADEGLGTRIMTVMIRLHIDLYARLPGQLYLGFMAVLFAVAVISGVVLYHPYMKKTPFGTVRTERASRLKWLDLHNLLGIVTLVWALMMGVTGAIHELAVPAFRYWLSNDVQAAVAVDADAGLGPSPQASVQQAYATAKAAVPGRVVESLRFPNAGLGLPHHYLLWAKGETPLGAHLFDGVLVDARTGRLTAVLEMPWYLRVLQFSRPLHYGDTAGLPLKIIWAALDLIVIVILVSGLYLWRKRKI